jgi:hypothetical protein
MRRRSEMPVPANPDDVTLARHLAGLRRRVRTILIARGLLVAMSLAIAAVSIAVVWPVTVPAAAWASAFVVAAVAAVTIACLGTPNVREIAATVDRRLRLADATVTAAALHGSGDPMARLVVRNTIAHLVDQRMASAFPLELGRATKSAVGAALVCIVVAAGITRWQVSGFSARGGMRIGSGESQTSANQRSPQTGNGPADRSAPSTMSARSTPASPQAETRAAGPADDSARSIAESQSERSTGATAASDDARAPVSSGNRQSASQASSDSSRLPASGPGPGTAVSGAQSTASRSRAEQTGAAPRGQAARPGRAGGSGSDEAAEGAGGIQHGGLRAEAARPTVPAAASYRQSYRAARARVDSAIARDEVPLSRRAYVRDYFLAIAPRD